MNLGFGDLRIIFRYESYRVSEVSEDSGAWDEDRMTARTRARRTARIENRDWPVRRPCMEQSTILEFRDSGFRNVVSTDILACTQDWIRRMQLARRSLYN